VHVLFIKELHLLNFRNYEREELQFEPGICVIRGGNGQGKSNLLEAIYCLCFARSFRNYKENDLVRWNSPYYYLRGTIFLQQRFYNLEVGYEVQKKRKVVKIDGKAAKSAGLEGRCPLVCFVPEDLELIRRGPEERRRFLDREISQLYPLYGDWLRRYNRVVYQKNRALKEKRQLASHGDFLKVWNKQLVYFGSRIVKQRAHAVAAWGKLAARNYCHLFAAGPRLLLKYVTFLDKDLLTAQPEEIEAAFKVQLASAAAEELQRGFSLVGPHRDDLSFLLDEREARRYASHGQQRSAVIALKAAQLQYYNQQKEKPVFILDDVFSELDAQRRRECFNLFKDAGQVFLTMTEKEAAFATFLQQFAVSSVFHVQQGRVRKEE
jgi:DNA replication and repair protein RecF